MEQEKINILVDNLVDSLLNYSVVDNLYKVTIYTNTIGVEYVEIFVLKDKDTEISYLAKDCSDGEGSARSHYLIISGSKRLPTNSLPITYLQFARIMEAATILRIRLKEQVVEDLLTFKFG